MAQFKILQALEEVIFEIMVWLMLLPKTLLQVIFKPQEIITYVGNECVAKKPEAQFDEFLSPIVFWIIVAVLPLTYALLSEADIQKDGFLAVFLENRILFGAGIASLLLITYLTWIELVNNRPIRKSALKRMFYIQCYFTSPAVLIITLIVRFTTTLLVFQEYLLAAVLFVLFYESIVMKHELEVTWSKAVWKATQPMLIIVAFIALIVFIGQTTA
ncbi:MAG: hypothetical protein H6634_10930 [Anaerolineales bacterium]|nr:hypothetical protein [Anaerolineales bacterium]